MIAGRTTLNTIGYREQVSMTMTDFAATAACMKATGGINMANRLLVSFSGGRSSAYMMKAIWENYFHRYEILNVFANTGQESNKTLDFVDACSREWGIPVTWVEAKVFPGRGIGTRHHVVNYETASRTGTPFESVVAKYGISNVKFPHCTRELKQRPITSYVRSIGWKAGSYETALGIRADEPKRVNRRKGFVYPLVDWFSVTKPGVNDLWEEQDFQLGLLEHQGNCKWCWKKSLSKLIRIAKEDESIFAFPAYLERRYGSVGPTEKTGNVFFRGNRSAHEIVGLSKLVTIRPAQGDLYPDEDSGCSESCEAFV